VATPRHVTPEDASRLQDFLRRKLNPELVVQLRQRPDECAEIYLGGECLGVVEKILDEGEVSFSFEISIIEDDLDGE
jgi:hypothetical protein